MKKVIALAMVGIFIMSGCSDETPKKDSSKQLVTKTESSIHSIKGEILEVTEGVIQVETADGNLTMKASEELDLSPGQSIDVIYEMNQNGEKKLSAIEVVNENEIEQSESNKVQGIFFGKSDSHSIEIEANGIADIYVFDENTEEKLNSYTFEEKVFFTYEVSENGRKFLTSIESD